MDNVSGDALPPALIYEGKSRLQSSWVDAVEAEKHQVLFANSVLGWTNNELGLAGLEQVFDGHGSHLTTNFIDFCDGNRILLAIFPPHATHSL
jgi:hypothetical protein